MPTEALKSMAKKHGKSVKTAERYWNDAKDSAAKSGHSEDYAYIMGIVRKRLEAGYGYGDEDDDTSRMHLGDKVWFYFLAHDEYRQVNYRGDHGHGQSVIVYDGGRQMTVNKSDLHKDKPSKPPAQWASTIESSLIERLCILGGFVEQGTFAETAAPKAQAVQNKRAAYQGAEKRITKPPKYAFKIFSTDNPFDVEGLKYAEFSGKGIEHAAYDPKSESLWISFSGQELLRWYWYKEVPQEDWDKFRRLKMNAIVYFNKEIRPIHDYALIEKA